VEEIMITSTLTGSKVVAGAPVVAKTAVVVLTASMGIGLLIGLALAASAGGFYVYRKLSDVAEPIT
jgi:uncharacterized membrane protein